MVSCLIYMIMAPKLVVILKHENFLTSPDPSWRFIQFFLHGYHLFQDNSHFILRDHSKSRGN